MDGRVGVLGSGLIGASWAALFAASGREVRAFDPRPGGEDALRGAVAAAWPALATLGRVAAGADPDRLISFHSDPADAVDGCALIQENAPERSDVKRALYAAVEPALASDAILASSTSGLTLSDLQAGLADPSPLVVAHPFNPPHLIPLVELMANARTRPGALETAERFYVALGKTTIRLKKEVVGHVANRLQAALWREAVHLAAEGVASVEDIDRAVWAGPGLRWAALGPHALFHLAAEGGIEGFCAHLGPAFERWWADLGAPSLDEDTVRRLAAGLAEGDAAAGRDALATRRDALLLAAIAALQSTRGGEAAQNEPSA